MTYNTKMSPLICKKCRVQVEDYDTDSHFRCPKCNEVLFQDDGSGELEVEDKITIDNFHITAYISWDELKDVFNKREHKKFMRWMVGQTTYLEGVYVHDLERYLAGGSSFYF